METKLKNEETKTTHYITIDNFENLVKEVYGQTIEVHADQELGNDDGIVTSVKKGELDSFDSKRLNEFLTTGRYYFLFHALTKDLCNKGYIDEGDYIFSSY